MTQARRRALRILVADDDRDAVLTLMMLLCSEGHSVRAVYGGADVLGAARDFGPDAIVLDIAMPGMSGHEVARALRTSSESKQPLLIAVSGRYMQRADRMLAALNGFNHYLIKPYDPQALLALLR